MNDSITISSEAVVIDAPVEQVWQVIVDFASYGEWNTFCPSAHAVLAIGEPITMQVDLGFGLQEQVEYITAIEAPHKITWSMANQPGDPIHADRSQELVALSDTQCRYVTYDVFSGDMAATMVTQLGERVRAGFNRCAKDLKARAEALAG